MHLDIQKAIDLTEGRLGNEEEAQWNDHIACCQDCRTAEQEWRDLRTALGRSHLQSAPQLMLDSAIRIFQPNPQNQQRSGLRQLIAQVAFDSFSEPAFAGARGTGATRQVVLRTEEFDIHIRIWMTDENRALLGQIQPRGNTALTEIRKLHLLQLGEMIGSVEVNDLGEFYFSVVPEGPFSLQIDLPHLTVIGALDEIDGI